MWIEVSKAKIPMSSKGVCHGSIIPHIVMEVGGHVCSIRWNRDMVSHVRQQGAMAINGSRKCYLNGYGIQDGLKRRKLQHSMEWVRAPYRDCCPLLSIIYIFAIVKTKKTTL